MQPHNTRRNNYIPKTTCKLTQTLTLSTKTKYLLKIYNKHKIYETNITTNKMILKDKPSHQKNKTCATPGQKNGRTGRV